MNRQLFRTVLAFALLGHIGPTIAADENAVPTKSVTAPNTAARVAAFAKLPNWMGFWEQFDIGPSGRPDPAKVQIATGGPPPQFTAQWEQRMATEKKHNPNTDRVCTFGFPTLLESSPLIFEIISVPEETAMIFNMREVRHIYTDGNGHAPEETRLTTPWGDSVGRWDGSTLYIETIGTDGLFRYHNAKGEMDSTVLNEDAVFKERLHMVDPDTLEDSFTVEDPVALREPYRFVRRYHRIKTMTRVVEELDCESTGENERNPIINGQWTVSPPQR